LCYYFKNRIKRISYGQQYKKCNISNSVPFEEYNEKIADEKVKKAEIIFKKLKKEYSILEN